MKLFTASQIKALDRATIAVQGISSLELMERAATACCAWIVNKYSLSTPFLIFCGMGNNGGDGFALARLLLIRGYSVIVFAAKHRQDFSPDAGINYHVLKQQFPQVLIELTPGDQLSDIPHEAIVVDAFLGTGLSRPLTGYLTELVAFLNALPNEKVAIDIPSGLGADECPTENQTILSATHTLSFQQYKRTMLQPEGGQYCGNIDVLDIGLDAGFQKQEPSDFYTLDKALLRSFYKPRPAFSNKGTFGTAMLIGGSKGMMGAVVLASKAAARAGCGKVKALIPECGYTIFQTSIPEAMCLTSGQDFIKNIEDEKGISAVGIGSGMGTDALTVEAFWNFLKENEKPIVVDADTLNILGDHKEWLSLLPKNAILTPHPKEFERLFGPTKSSCERNILASKKAQELDIIIVAKDTHTFIALPNGLSYFSLNGNAGLATGGTGDVLCGMITGLLAQGYQSSQAALLGVFLHGAAGDAAALEFGQEALLAGDVVSKIGVAFSILSSK